MTLKLSLCCYCFVCYWNTVKQPFSVLNMTLKLFLACYCFVFAIGNTVKQPFNCLQYDTQTVLVLLLICFAIGNTVKHRSIVSMWHSNCFWSVIVLFCYWKYSKATVQLSPIWHSNCSGLVIVLFCYWKYSKAPFIVSHMTLKLSLSCYCFCFAIGKYGKTTVQLSQYDTQTVLVLLLFSFALKIQ